MANINTYNHGLPWEDEHGIAQGYCVNGTLYISGQFSHDIQGTFVGVGDIEIQTRQRWRILTAYWQDLALPDRTSLRWRSF